ncbi:MAG: HAAS signaling domain-containing protein [Oscillospiraceae bacterium]
MTVIDRQKYVAELGKLLSGMAPQDREAVLRGINARFDAEGDDAAVIAALGSPTFAAVTVLRGYTPPEEGELGSRYEPGRVSAGTRRSRCRNARTGGRSR